MSRTITCSVAFCVIVVAAGLANGLHNDRWRKGPDLPDFAAPLAAVPVTLGEWQGSPEKLDDDSSQQSQSMKFVSLRYRNTLTGDKVSLLLVCGRPGPVS